MASRAKPTASADRMTRARSTSVCAGAREDGGRRAVEGDASGAAGGVEVGGHVDGDAVAHLDHRDVVAHRHEQHVGQAAAEHDAGVAGGRAVGDGDRAARGRRRRTPSRRRGRAATPPWWRRRRRPRGRRWRWRSARTARGRPPGRAPRPRPRAPRARSPSRRAPRGCGGRASRGRSGPSRTRAGPRPSTRAGRGRRRGRRASAGTRTRSRRGARWSSVMAIDMGQQRTPTGALTASQRIAGRNRASSALRLAAVS